MLQSTGMNKILEQLKRRRKELNLTQEEMMLRVGMSRQQYQRLESRGNPTLDNLDLIAKGLKMELMLIPQEKVNAVKAILEDRAPPSTPPLSADIHESTTLADDPWKGLLTDNP
jgi:transcriptional regulator with XRE-family HTH domain